MVQIHDAWFDAWLKAMGYEVNPYVANMVQTVESDNPRFLLIYGGERSGKSYNTVAFLGKKLKPNKYPKQRLYWIVGPDYASTRAEFTYLHDTYKALGLVAKASMPENPNSRWSLELKTNERWETRTSADIRKLASFTIWGCLIVEANSQDEDVWPKLRGRLAEKRGWAIISGTYENTSEWFVDLYDKWSVPNPDGARAYSLPTWANSVAFPGGEQDEEILALKRGTPSDWFEERYGGVPQKPSNLVVPEFEYQSHVNDEWQHDPAFPVELAIDPAKHTYAVAFVQKVGDGALVLDAIYKHGWIAQKVIPLAMQHPLWPYVKLGTGYAGAIDIAGFAEPGTVSQAQLWRDIAGVELYGQKYPELETINAVRNALADHRLRFRNLGNESYRGLALEPLAEFRLWRKRAFDEPGEVGKPLDRNNDFIKALGYWWLWRYGQTDKRKRGPLSRKRDDYVPTGRHSRHDQGTGSRPAPVQSLRRTVGKRLALAALGRRRSG